jgi:hypothetical protein
MSYEAGRVHLPETELGPDRHLQIGYFGHGDIFMATWNGYPDHRPTREDGRSTCFNMSHGSDLLLLASCVGYLRRIGRPEEEIRAIMSEAGREVLQDDIGSREPGGRSSASWIARGTHYTRYDRDGLESLVPPITAQPGLLDRVGGTSVFTRPNPSGDDYLVFASLRPGDGHEDGTKIHETADFCRNDIPDIAELVCNMALGEYLKDLKWFLEDDTLLLDQSQD